MADDVKCLRILKEGVYLEDIFKEEFLNKLNENFGDKKIIPVGAAFILKSGEVTEDIFNLAYRNDNEIDNNIVLIEVNDNPENLEIIKNSLN
ncbi:MAG: hypothetical protein E7Z77_02415 [Methanobrevibacter sp.]|uniref:hypothetical protein n=1 Tax=Methanobrevibacter sp. TaxID=66852 RepID=UPI0025EE7E9D|nr:hypothetical protein [Methanobrevibacter sp.]MBE6508248.1 hypothetical protein [Methanobrevibacter sp.]